MTLKYLVVLDSRSATGGLFEKDCDLVMMDGEIRHPTLACSDVEMGNLHYIFATRPTKKGSSHQSLFLPHHSVVMVFRYDGESPEDWPANVIPIDGRAP